MQTQHAGNTNYEIVICAMKKFTGGKTAFLDYSFLDFDLQDQVMKMMKRKKRKENLKLQD
jgi:hypothetical protein